MKEVFEIAQATKNRDGLWFVIGRTYSPINIGDTVSVIVDGAGQQHDFKIIALLMYERTMETIYPGDAAKIVLEGKNSEILQDAKALFA